MEMFRPSPADKKLIQYLSDNFTMYGFILERAATALYNNYLSISRQEYDLVKKTEAAKELDNILLIINSFKFAHVILVENKEQISSLLAFAALTDFAYVANIYAPADHKAKVAELIANKRKESNNTPAPKRSKEHDFTVGKSFDFYTSTKS